jgi:CubicO group peptidase (beta-lactamase class C family)
MSRHSISPLCVCLALAFALFACSDPSPEEPAPDPRQTELDSTFAEAAADGFVGAALVRVGGTTLFAKGYGLANRETRASNTTETAFDVGSLMKDFTAAAVFLLAERGRLSLDDTLVQVLPDVPDDKAGITLRELLQHRAGFDTYHDDEGDFEAMTREEARERILAQELLFEPGSDEEYSNSGYTLLADIIETASGEPYTDFVRNELFAAAGMHESGFYSDEVWQTVATAVGYGSDTFGDNDPATWPYTWALVGNGGLVSTVEDLDRWLVALQDGLVLSPATFQVMRAEYLERGAVDLCDEVVYAGAGAGDFGLGGVAVMAPARSLRILLASNAYDAFDIEAFAGELVTSLLCAE